MMLTVCGSALAHSWYPASCCREGDCAPIDCAALAIIIAAGEIDGELVKQSQDEQCHLCRARHEWMNKRTGQIGTALVNVCAFRPVELALGDDRGTQ